MEPAMTRFLSLTLTFLASAALAHSDNWPAWRGPSGQGFVNESNIPLKWSATENVKWKIPLADAGNSTPVIWGNRIFLTQANKGGSVRSLFCFSRADGKELWRKDVKYDEKERNWTPTWYANASPATDGERVIVTFGSAGVYCYDFDGQELWKRTDLGKWEHAYGNSASPVLYGDLVIQWCGPNEGKGHNTLLAMDKKTGKTVWTAEEKNGSWATPLIVNADGHDQLLLAMGSHLKSYDPKTGSELWRCEGLKGYQYPSAIYGNGVVIGAAGYNKPSLAVKLGGSGDITKNRLWVDTQPPKQRVGSGLILGEHFYIIDADGRPRCIELATGKDLWKEDAFKAGTWGSMIHADGRLYVLMKNAETVVLAANPKFEHLATNSLERAEGTNSSLAVSDGEIFIRTFKNLWCIAAKP
jgi:outer membrane protein assembly factor BamB